MQMPCCKLQIWGSAYSCSLHLYRPRHADAGCKLQVWGACLKACICHHSEMDPTLLLWWLVVYFLSVRLASPQHRTGNCCFLYGGSNSARPGLQVICQVALKKQSLAIPEGMPPQLAALCKRALAFEPSERPQFSDVVAELQQFLQVSWDWTM